MDDPLWYKDAIIYEVHIRAFHDSNGDGIGDFAGLTQKLDYIRDLGVTALWLLPFYPSPLKDDGYDIARYTDVHPMYGTMADFKEFLTQAHARGLRVITELVLNHTSDQHEWFQRSRSAEPGSPWRDFYVWSDTPKKYEDARIIFKDFETSNWSWDPVAKAYYWHRFYAHQPDLNWDNPEVVRALEQVLDFWLDLGVDGLRLDAIPYLFEREATSCENLPETHVALKELRKHLDAKYQGRMFLAEANQWPEDAVAYFGDGDECHMCFHFPVMPRLFMALAQEDRYPIMEILEQTPAIPPSCQWAMFLRNHDELTLEMVTDEDRDYMYRTYAKDPQARINLGIRRRLAPLLGNDRATIKLLNGLLFSFPGTPVMYYGDEINMGDNIYLGDRNGVRTPMQWSADRNAGFSRTNPQKLYLPVNIDPEYHYEANNVEMQQNNSSSPLWWMKRLIALRRGSLAFGRGRFDIVPSANRKVISYLRRYEEETILVVANLSRFPQHVELDLSAFEGRVPVEMMGRNDFAPIGSAPYHLSLGTHDFYWFSLEPRRKLEEAESATVFTPQVLRASDWQDLVSGRPRLAVTQTLAQYVQTRRWFLGKGRPMKGLNVMDVVPIADQKAVLALVCIEYVQHPRETYALPLAIGTDVDKNAVIATLDDRVLFDASWDKEFDQALLAMVAARSSVPTSKGALVARGALPDAAMKLEPRVLSADQSNTSILFGDRYFLKLVRRVEPGISSEVELGQALNTEPAFAHSPKLLAWLEYVADESRIIGVVHEAVVGAQDAWAYTSDALERFFERVASLPDDAPMPDGLGPVREMMGSSLQDAERMGELTAKMHQALLRQVDPAFAPEPIVPFYQRSLFQQMRTRARQSLQLLRDKLATLEPVVRAEAEHLLSREGDVLKRLERVAKTRLSAQRMRVHGDLHLGQLLHTGKDFVIVDYEGEPSRPLSERRIKRSPLKDIAGMLRSFSYAALSVCNGVREQDRPRARLWARFWIEAASEAYMKGYLASAGEQSTLPRDPAQMKVLLDAYMLDKALYELAYEISARPSWALIPITGLLEILGPRT